MGWVVRGGGVGYRYAEIEVGEEEAYKEGGGSQRVGNDSIGKVES